MATRSAGSGEDLDQKALRRAIGQFPDRVEGADVAIPYFATRNRSRRRIGLRARFSTFRPDGSDRERSDRAKIMIGHSTGSPIVPASLNNLMGLPIAEGIQKALAVHGATGLGAGGKIAQQS